MAERDDRWQRTSTIDPNPALDPDEPGALDRMRRLRILRRLGMLVVFVIVVLGATGLLGVKTRRVSAAGDGFRLEVTYAQVARPALAVPWGIEVRAREGFDGPIVLATTAEYFDLFDENGLSPEVDSSTADGELEYLTFEPPEGNTFEVSFDARIGPNVQWGKKAETTLLIEGRPVAQVEYRTWILP